MFRRSSWTRDLKAATQHSRDVGTARDSSCETRSVESLDKSNAGEIKESGGRCDFNLEDLNDKGESIEERPGEGFGTRWP